MKLKNRFYIKDIYKNVSDGLFFSYILSMAIEGLIDFIVFGYLNIVTKEFGMNGEIMGFIFGTFSISLSGIILPLILIILILFTKPKEFKKRKFK